jgi:hypothetical protein
MLDEHTSKALGYVWGRQDMGDDRCQDPSAFATAYGERWQAYGAERVYYVPAIADAYEHWLRDGKLADDPIRP